MVLSRFCVTMVLNSTQNFIGAIRSSNSAAVNSIASASLLVAAFTWAFWSGVSLMRTCSLGFDMASPSGQVFMYEGVAPRPSCLLLAVEMVWFQRREQY